MKRDIDLCKKILCLLEESERPLQPTPDFRPLKRSQKELYYHVRLLEDDGFLEVMYTPAFENPYEFIIERITAKGHDFLDLSRSDTIGTQAKSVLKKKGIDWSLQILFETMKALVLTGI